MTIRVRCQTNVSKQTTLLDGVDVGPPEQRVCWRGLNRSFHEAMNNISNVKVHLSADFLSWSFFKFSCKYQTAGIQLGFVVL